MPRRLLAALAAAVPVAAVLWVAPANGSTSAPVQPYLAQLLSGLADSAPVTVFVHGTDAAAAASAARASGLSVVETWRAIDTVVARGTAAQARAVRTRPGVTYVEGNQPIRMFGGTDNVATRGDEARSTLTGADGLPLDGSGVSVAVIDSGVDGTHPYLTNKDGSSAVVRNLKDLCLTATVDTAACWADVPTNDTDTLSLGGHGTHVAGIVAGRDTTLSDGTKLHGAAPAAKIVSLSVGEGLFIYGADSALNWVLENHAHPCGTNVPATTCPPIKVTNNSYGPSGGGTFDPNSATVQLQRKLVQAGVVTVWAAGNDGGDGTASLTNPPGQDPTGGIISVASYNDLGTGTRDGKVSDYSSRGQNAHVSTYPDISAPGENIESACRLYLPICSTGLAPANGPGPLDIGTFNTISGTSMAAPHIAGIVAQLFQADPAATPAQVESALELSAYRYTDGAPYEVDPNGGYTSFDKGHGLVDVVAAYHQLTGK